MYALNLEEKMLFFVDKNTGNYLNAFQVAEIETTVEGNIKVRLSGETVFREVNTASKDLYNNICFPNDFNEIKRD